MEKYRVELSRKAYRDLDAIYDYITNTLLEPEASAGLMDKIEEAVFSLETMPNRYAYRSVGIYANKGYRQMRVRNYIVIYRVNEAKKTVLS